MSDLEIKKITDRAGTGSPNFTNGVKVSGTDSGLLAPTRTEGETQPDAETASNGDTFYDTVNDTYDILTEGAWTRVLGEAGEITYDFDIDQLTYSNVQSPGLSAQGGNPKDFVFNGDGTQIIVYDQSNDTIFEYDLSAAYDVSTMSYTGTSYLTSFEAIPGSVNWNPDGTKLYVQGYGSDSIHRLSASTPYDISTLSEDGVTFDLSNQDGGTYTAVVQNSGTMMFTCGYFNDSVYQYDLSTPYDMTSATYVRSLSTAAQTATPYGLAFNSAGTKMYVIAHSEDAIIQYNMTTPWDLSSASYANKSFSVLSQDNSPRAILISNDGTKFWLAGGGGDKIYQYSTGL